MYILDMFRRYSVSLMDEKWEMIINNMKLKHIPRIGELIYLSSNDKYYKVINIIHNYDKHHGVFIIVNDFIK